MVQISQNFSLSASANGGGAPLITAPLSGATPGTWQIVQFSGNGINMNYAVLLPFQYSTSFSYPLFVYLHENGYGNDQSGNFVLFNFESQGEGGDIWFNVSNFRNNWPCIVVIPMLIENADSSGNTQNWGGWGGPNPQPSELNVTQIVRDIIAKYSVFSKKIYVSGDSLGGIGTWEMLIRYNVQTGADAANRLFTAGWSESGGVQIYNNAQGTPLQTVIDNLRNVPIYAVRGAGDSSTAPLWDNQMYTAYGGQNNPGSFPATKAPNGNMWYVNDPNLPHDVWGTYRKIDSGDTTKATTILNWLFSQTSPAPAPVESPNGTFLNSNAGTIIDSNQVVWSMNIA